MAVAALVSTLGAAAAGRSGAGARAASPPLVLVSQTPWVSAAQPWFNLALGVSPTEGAASSLQVSLTFYGRFDDASDLQQAHVGHALGHAACPASTTSPSPTWPESSRPPPA